MLKDPPSTKWVWYASKSDDPVCLDPSRYAPTTFDGRVVPLHNWVCQAKDGGLHIDARIGRIDAHVLEAPREVHAQNWTDPYCLDVVRSDWYDTWKSIVDPSRIFDGALFVSGERIDGWVTVHGISQPPLRSPRMTVKACEKCANVSTWTRENEFFDPAEAGEQPVFVMRQGIFIREDIVQERRIAAPSGGYEPSLVGLKAIDRFR